MGLAQQKYALDIRHPFTRADARAAGITVKELTSSRYQKVFYNFYVSADVVITPQIRARAALHLADPDSYASHHTAAELWGLPVPHNDQTHITVPEHGDRLRRKGVKSHLGQEAARRTIRTGIPASTPEQTFIDLAAFGVNLVDLVVLGDAMLKAKLTTVPGLMNAIESWARYGTRLALRAARRGVYSEPQRTLERVRDALRERGVKGAVAVQE